MKFELHVLLYPEMAGDRLTWIAHCLNHEIVGYGATVAEARQSFEKTLAGEIAVAVQLGQTPLQSIAPAPRELIERWKNAEPLERRLPVGERLAAQGEAEFRLAA